MNFELNEAIQILERTPQTLTYFLTGLADGWLHCTEGEDTWNALQVVDHLIEGEINNWIPRLEMILREGETRPFPPFDRLPSGDNRLETGIDERLQTFQILRQQNVAKLRKWVDSTSDFEQTGIHPAFGKVKLRELLSTWVVHDFTHITQIVRVMANRYRTDVGPWIEYLGVLHRNKGGLQTGE